MTPFQAMLGLAGLSRGEAARFFHVRDDLIDKWCAGKGNAPEGVLRDLKALIKRQEFMARGILEQAAELGVPVFVHCMEPDIDWPSLGAWAAMAARVAVGSPTPVVFCPPANEASKKPL